MKFFPEHAKLKEDTAAIFKLRSNENQHQNVISNQKESSQSNSKTIATSRMNKLTLTKSLKLKNRLSNRNAIRKFNKYSNQNEVIYENDIDGEQESYEDGQSVGNDFYSDKKNL